MEIPDRLFVDATVAGSQHWGAGATVQEQVQVQAEWMNACGCDV